MQNPKQIRKLEKVLKAVAICTLFKTNIFDAYANEMALIALP